MSTDAGRIGLGTFELRPHLLIFHSISAERVDGAIALVADTLGDRAHLVARQVEPLELAGSRLEPRSDEPSIPAEIREAVITGFARNRFLRMLDEPDPRFDGLTPREAARCAGQRPRLERWLRTLENTAAHGRAADGLAPDVAMMRAELAMPDETLADAA